MAKKEAPLMVAVPAAEKVVSETKKEFYMDKIVKVLLELVEETKNLKIPELPEYDGPEIFAPRINEPAEKYKIADKRARVEGIILGAIVEIKKVLGR